MMWVGLWREGGIVIITSLTLPIPPHTHTHTHYIPAWGPEEGEYCPRLSFGGNEERGGEEPAGPGGLSKVPIECTAVSYAAHSSPFLPNTPPLGAP